MSTDPLTAILKCAAKFSEVGHIDIRTASSGTITVTLTIESKQENQEEGFHE